MTNAAVWVMISMVVWMVKVLMDLVSLLSYLCVGGMRKKVLAYPLMLFAHASLVNRPYCIYCVRAMCVSACRYAQEHLTEDICYNNIKQI